MAEIYFPSEDSYLLLGVLEKQIPKLLSKNNDLRFLEIGSGSGIQLKKAFELGIKKENIFSVDINSKAVEECRKLGFNCLRSNLFEKIKNAYDLIIFNPPYLPKDKREPKTSRISTTAGIKGNEIINEFLKQAKNHLNKNGRIFLLTSSFSGKINFKGYKKRNLGIKKLFFEELFVWELR